MNEQTQRFIEDLFAESKLNRLPENYDGGRIFAEPITGVSRGDDPIFQKFKAVVGPEHMTPAEMWVQSGLPDGDAPASHLRILSIIFPYVDRIREESKKAHEFPVDIYRIGRNFANDFMSEVLERMVGFFQDNGFSAIAGTKSNVFTIITKLESQQIYSVWSERHVAFAAGLGTFSLHEGLITEKGCNIRVASVVTDAPLKVTPRKSDDPYANCLYYAKGKCRKCMERCPGDAITEAGHDKIKCYICLKSMEDEASEHLSDILKPLQRTIDGKQRTDFPTGCAFCQFNVPCMSKNPMVK